jgi:HEAT repeat protein
VAGEIIFALGELKSDAAAEHLIEVLSNPDTKPGRKILCIEALGKIGSQKALEPLLEALRESDANVRDYALSAVASYKGKKVESVILNGFRDSFYKVRITAAKAAGEKRLDEATPFLKYRIERDEVAAVKDEAVRALGAIGSREAIDILADLFADKKTPEKVQIGAAQALMEKDPRSHTEAIINAMNQARTEKKTSLYNSLAKVVSSTKSGSLEDQAKAFLSSSDVVDKHYGLDLVILNSFRSLRPLIEPLAKDSNPSLARKARKALGED